MAAMNDQQPAPDQEPPLPPLRPQFAAYKQRYYPSDPSDLQPARFLPREGETPAPSPEMPDLTLWTNMFLPPNQALHNQHWGADHLEVDTSEFSYYFGTSRISPPAGDGRRVSPDERLVYANVRIGANFFAYLSTNYRPLDHQVPMVMTFITAEAVYEGLNVEVTDRILKGLLCEITNILAWNASGQWGTFPNRIRGVILKGLSHQDASVREHALCASQNAKIRGLTMILTTPEEVALFHRALELESHLPSFCCFAPDEANLALFASFERSREVVQRLVETPVADIPKDDWYEILAQLALTDLDAVYLLISTHPHKFIPEEE